MVVVNDDKLEDSTKNSEVSFELQIKFCLPLKSKLEDEAFAVVNFLGKT